MFSRNTFSINTVKILKSSLFSFCDSISEKLMQKEIGDTKKVIRIRKLKDRQYSGQKKDKRTNNDMQNITHKTKDRGTRTPLNIGGKLRCSWRVGSSCSASGTRRVTLVTNPVISHEWEKDLKVCKTSGTYPCHLLHRCSVTVN